MTNSGRVHTEGGIDGNINSWTAPILVKNDFWVQFRIVPAIGGPAEQAGSVVSFCEEKMLFAVWTERKLGS